ncbi:hypothetical protein GOP47_0028976 [Adiantum capillus-veneris]|nr:hypothetical protein GOP47_0028976 [Adiantum capillus-veneris]
MQPIFQALVVTTDLVHLKYRLNACYKVQDLDENPNPQTRRGKHKLYAKRQNSTMTKPLLGVVNSSNIVMFVDNWLSEAVREMKKACRR